MKTKQFFRVIIAAAVVSGAPLTATAQQQASQASAPQKQEAKPATAKTAKVWSDDDLSSLRSPSDNYRIEQAREKEAQKAAAQQGAPMPTAAVDGSKPKTVQQADGMIADKQRTFASEQEYLQRVKKQANDPSVSGLEKERLEWRLESHTATAQHLASEIKQLQADRDALAKKPAASSNAPATPPPSQ